MDFQKVKRYCTDIRSGNLSPGKMPRRNSTYSGKKYTASDIIRKVFTTTSPISIRRNDYPYDVARDVEHNVMWFHPNKFDCVPEQDRIDDMLSNTYDPDLYDVAWFQNPREWQSIPDVPHVHVFLHLKS